MDREPLFFYVFPGTDLLMYLPVNCMERKVFRDTWGYFLHDS